MSNQEIKLEREAKRVRANVRFTEEVWARDKAAIARLARSALIEVIGEGFCCSNVDLAKATGMDVEQMFRVRYMIDRDIKALDDLYKPKGEG